MHLMSRYEISVLYMYSGGVLAMVFGCMHGGLFKIHLGAKEEALG